MILKPLDGISKYRLEMKDKTVGNLYNYWKKPVNDYILSTKSTSCCSFTSKKTVGIIAYHSLNNGQGLLSGDQPFCFS